MKQRMLARLAALLAVVTLLPILAACAAAGGGAPKEVVIGASIPKSGPLAAFGAYQEWAYTTAVNDVNKAGGLQLGSTKVPVKLVIYDDETKPEQTTQNVERLILKDGAHALLSSATPPLVLSGAAVAEREKAPMVATIAPIRAFLADREQWNYVWDIFFDEADMTTQQFQTLDTVETNKKIALFTDNEQDGEVMGNLWEQGAPAAGYEVVYRAKFPVGTSEYGDLIRKAQDAGAEVVIAQMIPPDAIALWKQMQALNYRPKAAFFEKAAENPDWGTGLGGAANGVMIAGFWHPSLPFPGAKELAARYESEAKAPYAQVLASSYTAAQVLLDAISRAGSLDREAINKAIGETKGTYVVGPIDFAAGPGGHSSAIPTFMLQWQPSGREIVFPADKATAPILYPLPPWSEVK